jgi:hypothetical protein
MPINITRIKKELNCSVNQVFQNKERANHYEITQEFVAPKKFFYDILLTTLNSYEKVEKFRVIDFGIGSSDFLMFFLQTNFSSKCTEIHYVGIDISESMSSAIEKKLQNQVIQDTTKNTLVNIEIISGVNLVDRESFIYEYLEKNYRGTIDLIISSQFEHYIPNDRESFLYKKISNRFMPLIKHEFRIICYSLLSDTGVYYLIDDRKGETESEDSMISYNWDRYVNHQFNDKYNLAVIAIKNKNLASKIKSYYSSKDIKKTQLTRELRRRQCLEEIEKLSITKTSLVNIFGEKVNIHYHYINMLSNFYCILAFREINSDI